MNCLGGRHPNPCIVQGSAVVSFSVVVKKPCIWGLPPPPPVTLWASLSLFVPSCSVTSPLSHPMLPQTAPHCSLHHPSEHRLAVVSLGSTTGLSPSPPGWRPSPFTEPNSCWLFHLFPSSWWSLQLVPMCPAGWCTPQGRCQVLLVPTQTFSTCPEGQGGGSSTVDAACVLDVWMRVGGGRRAGGVLPGTHRCPFQP